MKQNEKKNVYVQPSCKVITIDAEQIMAGSNPVEGTAPDTDDSEFGSAKEHSVGRFDTWE